MDTIGNGFSLVTQQVNKAFGRREPWQVATITATAVLTLIWLYEILDDDKSIKTRIKERFFKLIRYIPSVRRKIDVEISKISATLTADVAKRTEGLKYFTKLPFNGMKQNEILELVDRYLSLGNYKWKEGRVSGAVYNYNNELADLVGAVYQKTSYTNPLHPDVFPGINKMEAEVVRMSLALFKGSLDSVGTMTTGGTESIIMACKAYRDYGRDKKCITKPNIVLPRSAHSGFDKAAQYLGLSTRYVDVDPVTMEVNLKQMRRKINRNTVMLVGSAPNFPYGTMDDIRAIAELGEKYEIPVHVDACLGGFIIVFMKRAGYPLKPFDFSLPGVTSISADPHKYGFSPKGCSVILYSNKMYRNHQYTVTTDWPGGVYGSPTVNGSRAGGSIAACWATMIYFGEDSYIEATKSIIDTARYIERHLREIEGIFIFGKPATSVIALGSHEFDILRLSEALNQLGWNLNTLQFPSGIHICVTLMHTKSGVADLFVKDVTETVKQILKAPEKPVEGKMALYGVAQALPDRRLVGDITRCFLDTMYYTPK